MLKKVVIFVTIVEIIVMSNCVYALSLEEQKKDINEKIEETNDKINNVQEEKNDALYEIDSLNTEITDYENQLEELKENINNLNKIIQEKEEAILEQEEKYKNQKKLLEERLVAMYEMGEFSFLDVLLESDCLSDFISNYYTIATITEADEEILEKINNTKTEIEKEKQECENSKSELEISESEVENKNNLLINSKNKKQDLISSLSAEELELEEQLEKFEEDKKEIISEIAKLTEKNETTTTIEPSKSGYIMPISGFTKANITTDYHGYTKISGTHTGIDFACSAGTPIVAVKDGTVLISKALKDSNGNYRSYGEYIVIDHHDGTVTFYAHMLSGSRLVQAGENVKQGQQIGSVGSTGKATGNHLHFEVRINNGKNDVDPKKYLP